MSLKCIYTVWDSEDYEVIEGIEKYVENYEEFDDWTLHEYNQSEDINYELYIDDDCGDLYVPFENLTRAAKKLAIIQRCL